MIRNPRIAARVFNTPLMIHPAKLDAILMGLGERFGVPREALPPPAQSYTIAPGERRDPGYRVIDGVGVIDVFGVLAHRGGVQADSSYVLGYETIARRFDAAMGDPVVQAVLFQIDSPGGEVAGAFDLAEQIRAARGRKPIVAAAPDLPASAAYAIASAADEVVLSRTAQLGSIGVVLRHVDFSRALDAEGLTVTQIYAGARKVDGNPYEPLPDDVRDRFQAEIDRVYGVFVDLVARNRGLPAQSVRATEAAVYMGAEAIRAGLADRIETPDETIARLGERNRGVNTMPDDTREQAASQPDAQDSNRIEEARRAGRIEGARAERERIGAILDHELAVARPRLARRLALETDMDAATAARVLEAAAEENQPAASGASPFERAMEAIGNPPVDPDGESDMDADAVQVADAILKLIR